MYSEKQVRLMLWKRYFDLGYGWTSQLKYLLIALGLAKMDVKLITGVSCVYFIACLILGKIIFKYGWVEAMAEVGNRYNPLAKELRKDMKKRKV